MPDHNAPADTGFRDTGYLLIEGFLDEPLLTVAYRYAMMRAQLGHGSSDSQVPGTPSFYGDPLMETLLEVAAATLEEITGLELEPTYSYFRVYKQGDVLERHRDRPACEVSVSICLGLDLGTAGPEYCWPLHVIPAGNSGDSSPGVAIPCRPGDAVVYRGCEVWHWREALEGASQAQVFLHYVDRHGPNAAERWDRRPALGLPRT